MSSSHDKERNKTRQKKRKEKTKEERKFVEYLCMPITPATA
jgi:hypothetical protein